MRSALLFALCSGMLLIIYSSAFAQTTEIVVSATKIETNRDKVASSVSLISEEKLKETQAQDIATALQGENGVDVISSGAQGGNTAVFLRGANPEHTLILIDGIEANSSINPTRAFNLSDLASNNIERIEILRGPQSTLYGSDAMGGVINIITKKGSKEGETSASVEAGSYNTIISKAESNGVKDNLNYSLGALRKDSDNISSARGGAEHDPFQNTALSMRLGTEDTEELNGNLFLRYNDSRADLDNLGGEFGDDPNRIFKNEQFFGRAEAQGEFSEDIFEPLLGVNYTRQNYTDDNYPDEFHPLESLDSEYTGEQLKFTMQNNSEINDNFSLLLGTETENESGDSQYLSESEFGPYSDNFNPESVRTNGYYAQLSNFIGENFSANYGIRAE
jgi:vitamin B12 transporter